MLLAIYFLKGTHQSITKVLYPLPCLPHPNLLLGDDPISVYKPNGGCSRKRILNREEKSEKAGKREYKKEKEGILPELETHGGKKEERLFNVS